ncbi:MAG: hypothetical protein R3D29_04920 [Nitratireductor sp.]
MMVGEENTVTTRRGGASAELVATAMRKQTPLEIVGAGSRNGYGNPVAATSQVSTRAMSGITLYEPAALTIVARAERRSTKFAKRLPLKGSICHSNQPTVPTARQQDPTDHWRNGGNRYFRPGGAFRLVQCVTA